MSGKRVWRAARIALLVALAAMLLTGYVRRTQLLSLVGNWLNISSPLRTEVDDVFVLGGDLETRPLVAAAIIRARLARRVLIPQVAATEDVIDEISPPHQEIVRRLLVRSGVGADAIELLPLVVDSTDREAHCLDEYLTTHPGRHVAVVTSDYHTRRTRMLFLRVCRGHAAEISFVGAPTDGFSGSDWWRFESGLIQYTDEYLKLIKACLF